MTSSLFHYVFSTKNRDRHISEELQGRLWPYIGGIARDNKMKAIEVGGTDDHIHCCHYRELWTCPKPLS